jgi:hypothetical protein
MEPCDALAVERQTHRSIGAAMRSSLVLALCLHGALALAQEPAAVLNTLPASDAMGQLIISRDKNAPNACDVELYIAQRANTALAPGESVTLDVPAGEVVLGVTLSRSGYCAGEGGIQSQSIQVRPGEARRFEVKVDGTGVFLAPLLQ